MDRIYIGIGSNLADPYQQVIDVVPRLAAIRDCRMIACSALYRTEPVSDIPQEDFINAVACLETGQEPLAMLLELQAIEHAFYRQRDPGKKWAPRTMDLDIILFGSRQSDDAYLTLPHPEMHHRLFVLQPLREIAGDLYIPGLGSIDYLIDHAPAMRVDRVADPPSFATT